MEIPDKKKGMAIRMSRKKLRMHQYEYAEMIGSSASTVCEWEKQRRIPRGPTWKMICIMLERRGITFDKDGFPVNAVNDKQPNPSVDRSKRSKKAVVA